MGLNYNDVAIKQSVGFTVVAETKETYTTNTFTQYPNDIFDVMSSEGLPLTSYLSPAEEKVLNRCVREANGYHRARFRMSLSEMAKLTGLSKQGVINCIDSLSKARLILYNAAYGIGLWTLTLDRLEFTLMYYASQHRSTQFTEPSTELTSKKVKHRSTQFTEPSTELTSCQVSLPPSIKETYKENYKEITTTSTKNVAVENEENLDQLRNEVSENNSTLPIQEKTLAPQTTQPNGSTSVVKVQTPPQVAAHPPIDPLVVAYCEALTLNPNEDTAKKEAEIFVKKLLISYPDTTPEELKANVIHAVEALSLKTSLILKNWLKICEDIKITNSSEIRAIVASLKGIYGVSEMSYKDEWQFIEIAGQIKSMRVTASEVSRFKAIWPDNFMMPKLENFIASLTQNMSKIKENSNNGYTTSNATGHGVGELSQSVFDRLAAKSI